MSCGSKGLKVVPTIAAPGAQQAEGGQEVRAASWVC